MIRVATRGLRLNAVISRFKEKEAKKTLLSQCKNGCATYTRGYVVTCNENNLFTKSITRRKEELFINNLNAGARRKLSTEESLISINFEKISTETLESLSEYFDELIEKAAHLQDADVSCGDGVLTVKFGKEFGTYVINRQLPNLQIWLSSPKSGPKRYDFIDGTWIYKHDGKSMYGLLNEEIADIVKFPVSFDKCVYSTKQK